MDTGKIIRGHRFVELIQIAEEYWDIITAETYWYGRELLRYIGMALNFAMPIIFGKFAGQAYVTLSSAESLWNLSVWTSNWPVLLVIVIWSVGYIINRYNNHLEGKSDELYSLLKWLCSDLETRSDLSRDIRCTLWIPINRRSQNSPIRLLQIVPYYPKQSTITGTEKHEIRKNGRRFRTFRVSKKEGTNLKPIGILGLTAVQSVGGDEPKINRESFDSRVDFANYMVKNWNFSKLQAARLTGNRKAYLCFPITNRDKSQLLGILYFDSCRKRTFDNNFVNNAEKYLPRLASKMINQ